MSNAEDVGIALAARPTLKIVKKTELLRARARGMYQGLVAGLLLTLISSCSVLCVGVWFGPTTSGYWLADIVERFVASPGPLCFALGVVSAVGLYVYYRMARWIVKLPWREMWSDGQE